MLAAVDTDSVADDLFGDQLLDERGLALAEEDRRSVGEALAAQLRHADLVLTSNHNPTGLALIDRLRGRGTERADLFEIKPTALMHHRHRPDSAETRIDPRLAGPPDPAAHDQVWSWTLQSPRPVHPDRFRELLTHLVGQDLLSHGCFHLPSRPGQVGEWESVGGQVSLGDAGGWAGMPPVTRLRFVGLGARPEDLREAFEQILLTRAEARQSHRWLDADDGLEPWLGARTPAA